MRFAAVATLGMTCVALAGCGGGHDSPSAPKLLDEQRGTYEGVGIGSSSADIRARFGESSGNQGFAPLEPEGVKGPSAFSVPGRGVPSVMRYERVAFLLAYDRVFALTTSDESAVLTHDVGVGDSLQTVRDAYPFACREAPYGESVYGPRPTYTVCHAELANDSQVVVTKDPVQSITLLHLSTAQPPPGTRLIDEKLGTIGRIGIGATARELRQQFGEPVGASASSIRYPKLTFVLEDGRVVAFTSTDSKDITTAAARVGHGLADAASGYRYPPLQCGETACTGMARYNRYVRLSGDPVRSITVSRDPLR